MLVFKEIIVRGRRKMWGILVHVCSCLFRSSSSDAVLLTLAVHPRSSFPNPVFLRQPIWLRIWGIVIQVGMLLKNVSPNFSPSRTNSNVGLSTVLFVKFQTEYKQQSTFAAAISPILSFRLFYCKISIIIYFSWS